ncbi:UNVERIFIED_CONTAM: hypothetical protein FKN15_024689 [Acipenser sinensis]
MRRSVGRDGRTDGHWPPWFGCSGFERESEAETGGSMQASPEPGRMTILSEI